MPPIPAIDRELLLCCRNGDLDGVRRCLGRGANPDPYIPADEKGFDKGPLWGTPLSGSASAVEYAIWRHHDAILEQLFDAGATVKGRYKEDGHYARAAMTSDNPFALRLLIQRGISVDYRHWQWAQQHGYGDVVKALQSKGVTSAEPVYDIDLIRADRSARQVVSWFYEFLYDAGEQLFSEERIVRDLHELHIDCINGFDIPLGSERHLHIFARRTDLAAVGATRYIEALDACARAIEKFYSSRFLATGEDPTVRLSSDQRDLFEKEIAEIDARYEDMHEQLDRCLANFVERNVDVFRRRKPLQKT